MNPRSPLLNTLRHWEGMAIDDLAASLSGLGLVSERLDGWGLYLGPARNLIAARRFARTFRVSHRAELHAFDREWPGSSRIWRRAAVACSVHTASAREAGRPDPFEQGP